MLILALLACSVPDPEPPPLDPAVQAYCGPDAAEVEARIDALIAELSLFDKVTLMAGSAAAPVDGVYWTPGAAELEGLGMIDGPRGVSGLAGHATAFPVGSARGATWDPELERLVGEAMGAEARAVGATVLLAPTVNVLRHPRWGRAQETYGEEPLHLGAMGTAFVQGVQQQAMASVKHFAANSIEDTRFEVDVEVDERALREVYLPHFRRIVQQGRVASVMSAYNQVNGSYCAENEHLLSDILKGEWGFAGFVESDWVLGVHSTVPSVQAGLDVEMPVANWYGTDLLAAVEQGQVDEARVDDAVRRIARAQLCFELGPQDAGQLESTAHVALAREVAERGITLLVNDGALPLDRSDTPTIAVIGPLADVPNVGDNGSSAVDPSYVVTALRGLTDAAGSTVVTSVSDPSDPALRTASAVVVVAGLTSDDEGEGLIAAGDRETMRLSPEQEALITEVTAVHDRVVVVLYGGSAIVVDPWVADVEGLVMAWYPGMEGGHALASILYGDAEPSGRSPVSWPVTEADLPPFDNDSPAVTYDQWHGYRYLDRNGVTPRFAFGHGLSYTTTALSDMTVQTDPLQVEVTVTNTGSRRVRQTVQVYAGQVAPEVERPVRQLVGFTQIDLEPGAVGTARVEVWRDALAVWDGAWTVPSGDYRFEAGTSATALEVAATVALP